MTAKFGGSFEAFNAMDKTGHRQFVEEEFASACRELGFSADEALVADVLRGWIQNAEGTPDGRYQMPGFRRVLLGRST